MNDLTELEGELKPRQKMISSKFMVYKFFRYVGAVPGFGNNFANTIYGITSILEKVLKYTGRIVDLNRNFKCCA